MQADIQPDWIEELDEAPEPYWTLRRLIFTIIVLITLIAFLVYSLSWTIAPPRRTPIPPAATRQLV